MKKNIKLTEAEYEKLKAEFENADEIIEEAEKLKEEQNIETVSDFAFVLKIARDSNAVR